MAVVCVLDKMNSGTGVKSSTHHLISRIPARSAASLCNAVKDCPDWVVGWVKGGVGGRGRTKRRFLFESEL